MIQGLLGKKQSMTHLFTEEGKVEPVTAIKAGPCIVTQVRSSDLDGYSALQIGFQETKKLIKLNPDIWLTCLWLNTGKR